MPLTGNLHEDVEIGFPLFEKKSAKTLDVFNIYCLILITSTYHEKIAINWNLVSWERRIVNVKCIFCPDQSVFVYFI